jgi:hypothetical protein
MKHAILTFLFLILTIVAVWSKSDDPITNGINYVMNRDLVSDVQDSMQDNRFLKRVYPLIFRKADQASTVPELDRDFVEWEGKQISGVNIIQQEVFEINERSGRIQLFNDVLRFANMIHPKTRMSILEHNLFVSEGDSLNPDLLVANLQYLYDLGLYSELAFSIGDTEDESIEIDLSMREKFFLQMSAKLLNSRKMQVRLMDRNFLGLGHSMKHVWYVDPRDRESLG